jgi:ornithine decarboxylase
LATRFNGYGEYTDVILQDEPMYSIYTEESKPVARNA